MIFNEKYNYRIIQKYSFDSKVLEADIFKDIYRKYKIVKYKKNDEICFAEIFFEDSIKSIENVIKEFDVEKYGKVLEVNKTFPRKTNVEFVQILNKNNIKMRVWERGAGETLACGTGACATAVACNLNNLTERKVNIELLGGKLEIEWNEVDNHVYMSGPAVTVFDGELYEEAII